MKQILGREARSMPIRLLCCCLLLLSVASAQIPNRKGPDPYEKIKTQARADDILKDVLVQLNSFFKIRLRHPVQLHLVEAKVMDEIFKNSPYRGSQIGLYTGMENGRHQVYVMTGWNRDTFEGITTHELVHAWQDENGLRHQELAMVEGLAMWIESKYYDRIGAFQKSENVRETADPVYGVGVKAMLRLEDAVGAANVTSEVRKLRSIAELERKYPPKKTSGLKGR